MEWYIENEKTGLAKKVYHTYSQESDMTFILEDTMNMDTEALVKVEIKGFYYGEPSDDLTEKYYGELVVEFE